MTLPTNADLRINAWLEEEARDGAPPRLLDATRARLERTNQRRAAWPAWRPSPMNIRLAVVTAVVLIALAGGFLLLPKQNGQGAIASPSPTASSTPTQTPSLAPDQALLQAGRYAFAPFDTNAPGLRVEFTVPSGWSSFGGFALISPRGTTDPNGSGIGFLAASTVFSDPCHWDTNGTGGNPHVGDLTIGPAVADLANALASQTEYTSTAPTDTSIDGYLGKTMEIQSPTIDIRATCDKFTGQTDGTYWLWATNESCNCNIYVQGPGERRRLWILDVEGKRIVVFNNYFPGTSAADRSEAQAIIDSITISP
ncbi:MAG: hypothetical protein ACJ765_14610 [Chloroflexota bacterium]